jgi:hypothetical protein
VSLCNKDLIANGQPMPRTCARCGIGPCKKGAQASGEPVSGSVKEIGNRIVKLTHREIVTLAAILNSAMLTPNTDVLNSLLQASDEIAKRPSLPRDGGDG